MDTQVIVQGTLKTDGTLELDEKPNLPPGRVCVTVASMASPVYPERFWTMMEQIWSDLGRRGHVPRSVQEIEAERQAFREEWDQRQEALEAIHRECEQLQQQANQPEGPLK
jgi:hypothetical protein